jgi:predicted nucleic acid-binding protein
MKSLFVDTNVLLSFYHLTSEDLEELRKLVALIDTDQIKLVVTQQVMDEFRRNRSAKIVDAMKKLQEVKFAISFPAFAKDYEEYGALRTLLDQAGKKHSELVKTLNDHARDGQLKADSLIADLFKKAASIPVSNTIYNSAVTRLRRGNPPGKEASLGDSINWECLLATIESETDVHLVSEDKDYRSQLSPTDLNEFLDHEWREQKKSKIHFYTKISDFFKANFPAIKIASEVERDHLIERLSESWSFAQTHIVVGKLQKHTEFSAAQIEQLVQIAQSNRQVGWIVADPDVHGFYLSLLKHKHKLSPEAATQLDALVKQGEEEEEKEDDDDIPF